MTVAMRFPGVDARFGGVAHPYSFCMLATITPPSAACSVAFHISGCGGGDLAAVWSPVATAVPAIAGADRGVGGVRRGASRGAQTGPNRGRARGTGSTRSVKTRAISVRRDRRSLSFRNRSLTVWRGCWGAVTGRGIALSVRGAHIASLESVHGRHGTYRGGALHPRGSGGLRRGIDVAYGAGAP